MNETLLGNWHALVEAAPDAIALRDAEQNRSWTRRDVDNDARHWSEVHGNGLARRTVAFSERNGLGWLTVFIGLLKSDAVAAPFDPGEPPSAQRTTAATIGATHLWQPECALQSLAKDSKRPVRHRDRRRLIKLTSGSTGRPRPLAFTDAEMLADGRSVCTAMGIAPDDLNVGLIPWGHSYGLGNLIVPLLTQGTAILTGVSPLPHALAEACARWQPTVFPAVPAILEGLVESGATPDQLRSLRTVITAGAPITPDVAQAWHRQFGHKIHNFYGSSETGGIAYDASGERAMRGAGIGHAMPGVELTFTSPRRFVVRSPAVYSIGNRHPHRHRMPDLAGLASDGALILEGRTGRFVKIAGRRLNLGEVERTITHLPEVEVKEARVLPHPSRKDALAAVVSSPHSSAEIKAALRTHLASWKVPKQWVVVSRFPLTARGKIDLRALQALITRQRPPTQ